MMVSGGHNARTDRKMDTNPKYQLVVEIQRKDKEFVTNLLDTLHSRNIHYLTVYTVLIWVLVSQDTTKRHKDIFVQTVCQYMR